MELRGICKAFGDNKVLENISLEINSGERVLISAPSGRGKTTLLRIMMGLEKPDSGFVSPPAARQAAVFQEDRLPEAFTPMVCVKMTCPKSTDRALIREHLAELGLEGHEDKPADRLSGGMRRRVAIVRAVLSGADTIYFDEPFTGLDEDTKRLTADYILRHCRGKTLVFVSHCADDAELLGITKIIRI